MATVKNLFDEVIVFTDIHFGQKRNSRDHNEDCLGFVEWVVEEAKRLNIKTCLFLGDWHHNRYTINIETLQYSWQSLKVLNDHFETTYFIIGNHDLYLKDSRDIYSVYAAHGLPNIKLIDEKFTEGNVSIYPWLVKDEWKGVKKDKSKYIFGHFEIPEFYLNAMVKMPDNGQLQFDTFDKQQYVFTGHFHKRQRKNNVWYIGNAFPHDFNDINDDERGYMLLKWGEEPKFAKWHDAPTYRLLKYTEIKDRESELLGPLVKVHLKLEYDESIISSSEVSNYRDWLMEHYSLRTVKLIEKAKQELFEGEEIEDANSCDNVDKIVVSQLKTIDTNDYDVNMLIRMYNEL